MRHFNSGCVQGVRRGRVALVWAVAFCALALAGGCCLFDDDEPQQQVLMPQYGYPVYCCQPYQPTGANVNCQPAVAAPAGRTANSAGTIMPIPQAAPAASTPSGGPAYQQSP